MTTNQNPEPQPWQGICPKCGATWGLRNDGRRACVRCFYVDPEYRDEAVIAWQLEAALSYFGVVR